MTLRVAQVNCVLDPDRRNPPALLAAWPTLPAIAEATASAGADVVVIQASHAPARFTAGDVRYHFVPVAAARALAPGRLRRAVQAVAPDVIHLNGLDFPFHARAIGGAGIPMVVQDHASRPWVRWSRVRRWGHARAAATLFTAEAQGQPFRAARQLAATIPVLAVPENSSDFVPGDRATARMQTGIYGDPAILWVGRMEANKDPLTAIEAFHLARAHLPGAELWCVHSTDAQLPAIEHRLAHDPAFARHVHLLGRVPHARIEQLCRACDLFLGTSHREGSGYALIEALACGLPPVVSDIAPFRALVGDLRDSRFAPAGDARAFAEALVALAQRLDGQSRIAVRRHFDAHLAYPVIGRRLLDIYQSVIDRSARR